MSKKIKINNKKLDGFPKEVNLDKMNNSDFNKEMERRYKEAVSEDGAEAKEYFNRFKK